MAVLNLALLYCLVLLPPPLCKAEERSNLTAMVQGTLKSLELEWKAELEYLLSAEVDNAEFNDSCRFDFSKGCKEVDSQGEGDRAFLAINENEILPSVSNFFRRYMYLGYAFWVITSYNIYYCTHYYILRIIILRTIILYRG